jgi:hypothetical protein
MNLAARYANQRLLAHAAMRQKAMALEQSQETWTRVDLFCDGIGEDRTCVAYGDPDDLDADMPMVTDCCQSPEDARRLTLYAATREGWVFDIRLQRWLCPYCVKELNASRGSAPPRE